ncbi:MAG: beta-propeller domain-containing protein [Pseudomonadales bacterium]|nr:beta-propeller domain-containing protein [Pseudomonadales bacterium]
MPMLNKQSALIILGSALLLPLSFTGCSSDNSGGVTGTGYVLEDYIKHGLNNQNTLSQNSCRNCVDDSFTVTESTGAPSDAVSDGAELDNGAGDDDFSTTNVQEFGVDESDWMKTDGEYAYSYSGPGYIYYSGPGIAIDAIAIDEASSESEPAVEVQSSEPIDDALTIAPERGHTINVYALGTNEGSQAPINSLLLDETIGSVQGLYLHDREQKQQLVVLADKYNYNYADDYWGWHSSQTTITLIDTSAPQSPLETSQTITIDGQYVSSRKVGNTLYVISQFSPYVQGLTRYPDTSAEQQKNLNLINTTPLEKLLPQVSINGVSQRLLNDENCHVPIAVEDATHPTLAVITAIDLDAPESIQASCVAAPVQTIYASTKAVYMVSTQYSDNSSDIYQFSIAENKPRYQAMATVTGSINWNKPFHLSEQGEYLRLVTSTGDEHQLHILKIDADILNPVATLPNEQQPAKIGKPGESIYAVRFYGERVYVVTFRQTDPFYVIDLADPTNPSILGELEIPGFSTYLHPFSDNLIFGIGRNQNFWSGIKLALFDVSNPAEPIVKDEIILGGPGTYSPAMYNHRAVTLLSRENGTRWQMGLPVSLYDDNHQWQQDSLYLLDITLEDHAEGAGMQTHGQLVTKDAADGDYSQLSEVDRGIFKGDWVHFITDNKLWTQAWAQ